MTTDPPDSLVEIRLSVPGLDCASCARTIEKSVGEVAGVDSIESRVATGTVVVTYDPERTEETAIRRSVERAGYAVSGGDSDQETVTLSVPDMDCPSCAEKVERALERVEGVDTVETRPATGNVEVSGTDLDSEALIIAAKGAGYAATVAEEPSIEPPIDVWRSRRALATGVGAVLLVAGLVLSFLVSGLDALVFEAVGRSYHVSHVLFVASAALAGAPILRNGFYSARARNLDIDFLMSAGILAAVAAHHPFEGAALAVLFSIAQLLERFSMDRARDSLRELMDLSPDTATVIREDGTDARDRPGMDARDRPGMDARDRPGMDARDGPETGGRREETVPVESVEIGDLVAVRPGVKVPVDGIVVAGESAIDQSPITGESVPVDKTVGEEVYAGTINESGYVEVEATRHSADNTLSRIIRLVEDAESEKSEREQFVDRFAAVYTPIVVVAALATAVLPPLAFGWSWNTWFLRGLTLLVIACPCAFVISTPVSVVSGITSAARNGVLVKGGRYLEAMGEVETIAIDKTGTLTTGDLAVTDVIALNGNDEADVLRCAASLERRSEHPIAGAILGRAKREGVADREIEAFEAISGKGVRADLDGVTHYAGKPDLFSDLGFELEHTHATDGGRLIDAVSTRCDRDGCLDLLSETLPRLEREGKTIVLVGTEDELEGVIAIADRVRPEARRTVARLQERGLHVVMLTGDNAGTARAIATEVGVDDYRAELLPEEKLDAIRELGSDGPVAMVGDGINDAPALAVADVGIAMGAAGTDTALETADVALMGDDLSRLPYLHRLSRTANGVIRQNIGSSLAVKAVLAAGAPFGVVTVIHAVVIGDMGMSLAVTGNAMRLSRIEPVE